jgi:predicted restriction endonuclease
MSNDTTPQKTCTKCGQSFPATAEYFHTDRGRKDGLTPSCKQCAHEYYLANRDKKLEYARVYQQANPDKVREYKREYRQINQDTIAEYMREYRQANRDEKREKDRAYQQANKEHIRKQKREYKQANPDKVRISKQRRRARKANLPDTFTERQWLECLEYFNYCCAVCGHQLRDLFGDVKPHADHWIPVSYEDGDNPGTTADNMVCLCSECNLDKNAKHPEQWLIEKFGKRKAVQILERIQTYFAWTQLPK